MKAPLVCNEGSVSLQRGCRCMHTAARCLPKSGFVMPKRRRVVFVFLWKHFFQEAFFYELFLQNQTAFSTCRWLFATWMQIPADFIQKDLAVLEIVAIFAVEDFKHREWWKQRQRNQCGLARKFLHGCKRHESVKRLFSVKWKQIGRHGSRTRRLQPSLGITT